METYANIYSKSSIIKAFHQQFGEITSFLCTLTPQALEALEEGYEDQKWTIAQEFEHLLRSCRPVAVALLLPKFAIKMAFGKAKTPSKTYNQLRELYQQALKDGAKAKGRYAPTLPRDHTNLKPMIKEWYKIRLQLTKHTDWWKDADLDQYLLPHPILGKLTLREVLLFTLLHNQYHFRSMQRKSEHALLVEVIED